MIAPDPAPAAARPATARPESPPAEAPNRDRPESGAESGAGRNFGAMVAERPARRGPPDDARADAEPTVPVPVLSAQPTSILPVDATQVVARVAAAPEPPPASEPVIAAAAPLAAGLPSPQPETEAPPTGSTAPGLYPEPTHVASGALAAAAGAEPPAPEPAAGAVRKAEARPAPAATTAMPVPAAAATPRELAAREPDDAAVVESAAAPERAAGPATLASAQPAAPGGLVAAATGPEAYRLVLHETVGASWSLTPEPAVGHRHLEPAAPAPLQTAAAAPQAVIAQVAVAVGRSSERSVEIRLDPPELGRVQIHLTPADGRLQALVIAERPETQDLLRRHADVLARELGSAGYDGVSLDFAAGGEAPGGRQPSPRALGAEFAAVAMPAEPSPVAAAPRTLAGGLDVRL